MYLVFLGMDYPVWNRYDLIDIKAIDFLSRRLSPDITLSHQAP